MSAQRVREVSTKKDEVYSLLREWNGRYAYDDAEASGQTILLTRASYKMPRKKAEILAAFLQDQVKASILETKVEVDALVVTTTPEAQKTVSAFIAFVQGRAGRSSHGVQVRSSR